jgi:hypothetical protein
VQKLYSVSETVTKVYRNGDAGPRFDGRHNAIITVVLLHHPQSQNAVAMLLRRALPAARHHSAHPVPIYEMGSSPLIGILLGFLGGFLLYH